MIFKEYKPSSHRLKCLVYGASGVGKTRFGATAPKPVFLSAEAGLLSTAGNETISYAIIKTLDQLKEAYNELAKGDHGYETVVIDSITEMNSIIKEGIEKSKGRAMQLQDWGTLAKEIRGILRQFRNLDMHVIFIAQEELQKDDQMVIKIVPSLNGKATTEIAYYMDTVGYMFITDKGEYAITTKGNKKLLSKSRFEFDDELDFSGWVEQLKELKLEKKKKLPAKDNRDIHANWNELMTLKEIDKTKSDGIRKATLLKLYGVESNNDLTPEQAKEFIKKIKEQVKALSQEDEEPETETESEAVKLMTKGMDKKKKEKLLGLKSKKDEEENK